jgi:hypothetical protein
MLFLRLQEDTAMIGVTNAYAYSQLQHPGTQKAIMRALKYLTGRIVALDLIQIERPSNGVPG